jgi:hypothetical protein
MPILGLPTEELQSSHSVIVMAYFASFLADIRIQNPVMRTIA